jgi:hypothetical protein
MEQDGQFGSVRAHQFVCRECQWSQIQRLDISPTLNATKEAEDEV